MEPKHSILLVLLSLLSLLPVTWGSSCGHLSCHDAITWPASLSLERWEHLYRLSTIKHPNGSETFHPLSPASVTLSITSCILSALMSTFWLARWVVIGFSLVEVQFIEITASDNAVDAWPRHDNDKYDRISRNIFPNLWQQYIFMFMKTVTMIRAQVKNSSWKEIFPLAGG